MILVPMASPTTLIPLACCCFSTSYKHILKHTDDAGIHKYHESLFSMKLPGLTKSTAKDDSPVTEPIKDIDTKIEGLHQEYGEGGATVVMTGLFVVVATRWSRHMSGCGEHGGVEVGDGRRLIARISAKEREERLSDFEYIAICLCQTESSRNTQT